MGPDHRIREHLSPKVSWADRRIEPLQYRFPIVSCIAAPSLFFIILSLAFVSIGDVECGIICSGAVLGPPRCGRRQDTLAQCFVSLAFSHAPSFFPLPLPHSSKAAPTSVLKCHPGPVHYDFVTNPQNDIKRTRSAVACFFGLYHVERGLAQYKHGSMARGFNGSLHAAAA